MGAEEKRYIKLKLKAALFAQELVRNELISEKKTIAKLKDKEKALILFKKIYQSVQSKFKKVFLINP
jgi:hypothetical protein